MNLPQTGFKTLPKIAMSREIFNSLPDASSPTGGTLRKILIGDRWYAVESREILLQPIEIGTYVRED